MTETPGEQMTDVVYALSASTLFAQDGICFAACQSGLYRSVDGGDTWQQALESLELDEPLTITAVAVSPASISLRTVFAGTRGGVLRSSDGGTNWQGAI